MLSLAELSSAAFIVERRGDDDYVFVGFNAPAAALWSGQPRPVAIGATSPDVRLADAFPPDVASRIAESFTICLDGNAPIEREEVVPSARGEIALRMSLLPLVSAAAPRLFGIVTDFTRERRVHSELDQSNARLAVAMEALGGAHWFFDVSRRIFEFGPRFARVLGARFRPVMSFDDWLECIHPDDRNNTYFSDLLRDVNHEGTSEVRLLTRESGERWLRFHKRSVRNGLTIAGVAGIVVDVTTDKRRELMLSEQARTDPLTGLYNRRHLEELLGAAAEAPPALLSLLVVDVDQFKAFNDHYGHLKGDEVLKRIAMVLQSLAASLGGTAIRYGGEEFIIVLPEVSRSGAEAKAAALLKAVVRLKQPHASSDLGYVSVSIGVATRSAHEGMVDLLAAADAALYQAKREGRNRYSTAEKPVPSLDVA